MVLSRGLVCAVLLFSIFPLKNANASVTWKGLYRFELTEVENPDLDASKRRKSYLLHHMVLQPKVIAGDGLDLHIRMDILNDGAYPNSQLGTTLGQGPGTNAPTDSTNSDVLSQNQNSSALAINEAYLTWKQEYGALVIGRTPMHFGLGITHNAGLGEFDHWFDHRDLVGYKIVKDNFYFMPIIGKLQENSINQEDDVTDYIFIFDYNNVDAGLKMGVFYQNRIATRPGNDAPVATLNGDATKSPTSWGTQSINLYTVRERQNFRFGIEVGFTQGRTGVRTNEDENIKLEGYGIALDYLYHNPQSKMSWTLLAGTASGDNPDTQDRYEGYEFDRNYDVAFLLFNHPLGSNNFLGSSVNKTWTAPASARVDDEVISNVSYFTPGLIYKWKDTLDWEARFTYAALNRDNIIGTVTEKYLGLEFDLALVSRPYKNLIWKTELGFLNPGEAFIGGDLDYETNFIYGISTKAAISF